MEETKIFECCEDNKSKYIFDRLIDALLSVKDLSITSLQESLLIHGKIGNAINRKKQYFVDLKTLIRSIKAIKIRCDLDFIKEQDYSSDENMFDVTKF